MNINWSCEILTNLQWHLCRSMYLASLLLSASQQNKNEKVAFGIIFLHFVLYFVADYTNPSIFEWTVLPCKKLPLYIAYIFVYCVMLRNIWNKTEIKLKQKQFCFIFTALHGMQRGLNDEISVRLSVCPSVRLSNAWIVTKRKKAMFRFLYHMKDHLS